MPQPRLLLAIDDPRLAASLREWLLRDTRLRGRIDIQMDTVPGAEVASFERDDGDTLADPTAIVAVVLSTLMALPTFIASIRSWSTAQPPTTPPVVLRHGETSIEISGVTDTAAIAEIAAALTTTLEASEQAASPPRRPEEPANPHRAPEV